MTQITPNSNYYHANLVNLPPFITNHPVYEKLQEEKDEFIDNQHYILKKIKNNTENKFISTCILGTFLLVLGVLLLSWSKTKVGISKLKSYLKKIFK